VNFLEFGAYFFNKLVVHPFSMSPFGDFCKTKGWFDGFELNYLHE
jgi:hypothetical protein